ncbi:serine hydrolase domain-containing protein [Xanthovirga aplysinae]|uniref:serine hydrolase domain-containing protein n=1 Tax=Xanthovirga aplysinae TaxID=2529853 RepID=UPI0012BCDCF1|nr:serine hydrolase [Xanthovirga aplysinae]MTI30375.1 serine hydrolase [Xanthovirga aplysinae]
MILFSRNLLLLFHHFLSKKFLDFKPIGCGFRRLSWLFLFGIFLFVNGAFSQNQGGDIAEILESVEKLHGNELVVVDPGSLEIDRQVLESGIHSIIREALDSTAFPGCQILLAKDGKIFYEQSFGYHTYDHQVEVKNSDLYDLASITKTTAATLALMKLYENGDFDPDLLMGTYFPNLARSNKKKLIMREVLAHQGRLKSWIPYWSESKRKNGKYKARTVSSDSSANYPFKLSESGLYMHKNFIERKLYKIIKRSKLLKKKEYVYSGLSFYLYPDLIQRITGKPFDEFLQEEFYQPLGAKTMGFNAGKYFPLERIVPTEVDTFFRMQTLQGVVHDEGAAMMKGISGNAGLFSNARDLAKVYQMLLNGGVYEGRQYLKASTIKEFTKCQYPEDGNRRGMGFDKPLLVYDEAKSSVAKQASPQSFGHSGYTGTLVWADPANGLLFIFLSNRVHPTRNNRKIYTLNVRPRIHNLVYDLLEQAQVNSQE